MTNADRFALDVPPTPPPIGSGGPLADLERSERVLYGQLDQIDHRRATLRRYEATRATLCWDNDRRLDAEELALKLARRPAAVRARLARSKHGAQWLIGRWKALGALIAAGRTWTPTQESLAFDLLGVDRDLRHGTPWEMALLDSPTALVEREIRGLEASIARVLDGLDAFERREAETGEPVTLSAAMAALKREEMACWRRLMAVQREIREEVAARRALVEARRAAEAEATAKAEAEAASRDDDDEDEEPITPSPCVVASPARQPAVAGASLAPAGGNRRARRAALKR
ncbi:MAG: hypothetical protein K2X91_10970, partial [Thermoleophilia bacterium]|nr:hypothetical protein [Thermoleophilia bacterium]